MDSEPAPLPLPSRREILIGAIKGTVAVSLTFPARSPAERSQAAPSEPADFVMENDYPFFGYVPDAPARNQFHPGEPQRLPSLDQTLEWRTTGGEEIQDTREGA